MNWQEILIIVVPLFGLIGWVYGRIEKKADERYAAIEKRNDGREKRFDERFTSLEKRFDERFVALEKRFDERFVALEKKFDERFLALEKRLENGFNEIGEIKKDISTIKDRLTRLEGRFDERGYWESREWHRTGTDDKA